MWAADQEDRSPRPEGFSHAARPRHPPSWARPQGDQHRGLAPLPSQWACF